MSKVELSIEYIKDIADKRRSINKLDLSDIEFTTHGVPLNIPDCVIEKFEYSGLNNMDFITSGAYKGQ